MFVSRKLLRPLINRFYQPDYVVMPKKDGHWCDPDDVLKRLVNIFKAHDAIKDETKITPDISFAELGLQELDVVEVFLAVEKDFFMEFSDDEVETFNTIQDAVEVISNYRFADTY